MLEKTKIRKFATEDFPLIIILFGAALASFSMGPYQTYDTTMEFEAASNVVKMDFPYIQGFGTVIDQPPLGFYLEGAVLRVFGASMETGVALVTFLALGSVIAIYFMGKQLYGKTAGLFAAALFGLNPWQLVLARTFLIDTQCLFFSLLTLSVGVMAIRRGSTKLTLLTGLGFAAAFLTKFYAAFILIPLLLFYVHSHPRRIKAVLSQLSAFAAPTLLFSFLWYQIVLGRPLFGGFQHNDFSDVIPASTGVFASPFFATNFLAYYGVGFLFLAATIFSAVLGLSLRKYFCKTAIVDLTCLVTIVAVVGVNTFLGYGLSLNVPYFSAIKYDFQALPFLVLLAASLAVKGYALLREGRLAVNSKKALLVLAATTAIVLLAASLFSSMYLTTAASTRSYLQYRVEPQVDYGYALSTTTPTIYGSPLMALQIAGYVFVLLGLLWALKEKSGWLLKRTSQM